MSRSASASQRPRPRIACWRHGPGSPAASARIQPVLRCSGPSRPSRNEPVDAATRSCVNKGRIRCLASRSDDAHTSNVLSSEAPLIHLPSQPRWKMSAEQKNATVVSNLQNHADSVIFCLTAYGFCETPASVSWNDGVAKRPDTDEDNEDAGDVGEGA